VRIVAPSWEPVRSKFPPPEHDDRIGIAGASGSSGGGSGDAVGERLHGGDRVGNGVRMLVGVRLAGGEALPVGVGAMIVTEAFTGFEIVPTESIA
jgi:hypothetical protein